MKKLKITLPLVIDTYDPFFPPILNNLGQFYMKEKIAS